MMPWITSNKLVNKKEKLILLDNMEKVKIFDTTLERWRTVSWSVHVS